MKSPWNPRQEAIWAEYEEMYKEAVDHLHGPEREKAFLDWSTRRAAALDGARDSASAAAHDRTIDDAITLSDEEAKDARKYRRARKLARDADRDLTLDDSAPPKKRPDLKDCIPLTREQARDASTYRSASERARAEHKVLVLTDEAGFVI